MEAVQLDEYAFKYQFFTREFRIIKKIPSMELNGLIDAWARNFMVLVQA